MNNTAIKVENLSKIYRLGEIGTGSIGQDLDRWFKTKVLGKEDPFLKIGEANDRANKGNSDIVYSLRDINFEINQGDAVGIIGRNGAGKSTLLKVLSRVTTPATGKVNIKGRVASLLEVGTGFHPELTGRENIYLNGAILGMRKREIDSKLDEIIDFSGVERYIDTPVKRYSSGMYVRLAFAVAAHLESEILIVDEVLAVGDAEFQKKCLGKMGEVSKGEGRTVLFVSHNLVSMQSLCDKGIVLENGVVSFNGNIKESVEFYLENKALIKSENFGKWIHDSPQNGTLDLIAVSLKDEIGKITGKFTDEDFLNVELVFNKIGNCSNIQCYFALKTNQGDVILDFDNIESDVDFNYIGIGEVRYLVRIPCGILIQGNYVFYSSIFRHDHDHSTPIEIYGDLINFEISGKENRKKGKVGKINYSPKWVLK
jgi:lipopolysaccharide transport system ATP-binding protein